MSQAKDRPTLYHLISRFVAGEWFVKSEVERREYLNLLGDALKRTDWKCLAYAVMSNHVHLAMVAGAGARSPWLRDTHAPFGAWINERRERFGAVFAKEITTRSIDPDDVGKVIAYVHNNPVRAGVVRRANESTWTSHRAYLGACEAPPWLHVESGLALMGLEDRREFDRFVQQEAHEPRERRRGRGNPRRRRIVIEWDR